MSLPREHARDLLNNRRDGASTPHRNFGENSRKGFTKMKIIRILAVSALALSISLVCAQGAGPGQGQRGQSQGQGARQRLQGLMGAMGGPGLLLNASVQQELKMTPEQIEKAKTAFGALMGGRRAGQEGQGQGGVGAGGNRRQGGGAAGLGQQGEERRAEVEKQIKEILDEKQYERYGQISLQQQGAVALARKDVAERVGLSADQVSQIRKIQQDQRQALQAKMQELRGQGGAGAGGNRAGALAGMREELMKMREEANAKILGVLASEQKKKWDALLGPAFQIK